jgi:23S rRNA pseudouridine2605 synthase
MSRERNSGKSNNRNSDRRPSSPKKLKTFFRQTKKSQRYRHPKRGGERTFDSREKYEKGDLKFGKNLSKNLIKMTIEQNLSFKKDV